MKKIIVCLLLVAVVVGVGCSASRNPKAEAEAITAAHHWLALVDAEKYAESWDEAAPLFKGAITQEQWWVEAMQTTRKPFGKNLSRELKSSSYCTKLPGAPEGEYVVIQFKASFENMKSAIETITPMLGEDGLWRVSGYYMK